MRLILICFYCFIYAVSASSPRANLEDFYANLPKNIHEDAVLRVPSLIKKYGYPQETHHVTTIDGYILALHRIPHGKTTKNQNAKRPIMFLQHGILSSSADWIITGPQKGLGYLLAEEGYDVWMGNFRGNSYSRNHTFLDPDLGPDFWDFSWHEMGTRDLPAMIDYVLGETQQGDLFYVGHSQGTTAFYVMASQLPQYNSKIRAQFSMAPVAFADHVSSPILRFVSFFQGGLDLLMDLIGVDEFLPNNGLLGLAGQLLCKEGDFTQVLCTNVLFAFCGFSPEQMNSTLLPILMGHSPAGASVDQILHFTQGVRSGKFRRWDYGFIGNLRRYKRANPPEYDLRKVTAPVYLLYSENDWLSDEVDVRKLYDLLGNCQGKFLITDRRWNHLDYMFGIDAPRLAYAKIISLANRHR